MFVDYNIVCTTFIHIYHYYICSATHLLHVLVQYECMTKHFYILHSRDISIFFKSPMNKKRNWFKNDFVQM